MPSINDRADIAAPREAIVKALTTVEGNRGWWTRTCEVDERRAEFRFDGHGTTLKFAITEAGGDGVRMVCDGHEGSPEWEGTTVTWRLSDAPNGGTRVELAHEGWRQAGSTYNMCVSGWRHFMGSLKSYVETGAGQPA